MKKENEQAMKAIDNIWFIQTKPTENEDAVKEKACDEKCLLNEMEIP